MSHDESEQGRVAVGHAYQAGGHTVTVLHLAVCRCTRRDLVVYQGEAGNVLVSSLYRFVQTFAPVPEPEPDQQTPESPELLGRTAGSADTGKGW